MQDGARRFSTVAVEKSVDGLRECEPSARSAEEFYEMITKSPLANSAMRNSNLAPAMPTAAESAR
jgi:hypothetical protein